jgi:hypothetical protein
VTRPAAIQSSICLREPRPVAASSFCSRSPELSFGFGARKWLFFRDFRLRGRGAGFQLQGLGDFLQRRQFLQRTQPEVVEKYSRGGVKGRPARGLPMTHGVDPAAVLQRLDNLAGHRDPADVFDVAARDRLAVRDDRQGFHHRPRVARRLFGRQLLEVGLKIGAGLEAPAARYVHQLDRASAPVLAQLLEQILQDVRADFLREQALEIHQGARLLGRKQRPFQNPLGFADAVFFRPGFFRDASLFCDTSFLRRAAIFRDASILRDAVLVSWILHSPILRKSARSIRTA